VQAFRSKEALEHLTPKGGKRLNTTDNRCRAPIAATKLLPDHKWRHIRLPNAEKAAMGEDYVVLWAMVRHPARLTKIKAEPLLNYRFAYYHQGELLLCI
jgi:hypothetical protein